MKYVTTLAMLLLACTQVDLLRGEDPSEVVPEITSPPKSFFEIVDDEDREVAREFYAKYLSVEGMPVVAAAEVDDRALHRTWDIVKHMLAGRPDIIRQMVADKMYLVIIGKDQVYTDMPEYRNRRNPEYLNERVRGTGGRPTSFGEENLLSLPIDRYDDESIAVHEFAHTIDGTLRQLDPEWRDAKRAAFENAKEQGLFFNAYAGGSAGEYWAEIVQAYFDCDRANNWNHNFVVTREQLRQYDPVGYDLVRTTMRLGPKQDWRYKWLQPLPNVIAPPAKFKIDPFYTKFTYAREFPVIGRGASDAALLKANDTVRKMFAYRHDILKALINHGVKMVVLGEDEHLSQLPEVHSIDGSRHDLLLRTLEYHEDHRLIVVDQKNVLGNPQDAAVGSDQVIQLMAKAFFELTADRPEDPNWENRGRDVQQYELRVTRLDERFGKRVRELYRTAMASSKWKGTSAMHNPAAYWSQGVLAWFSAGGHDAAPLDHDFPVVTRKQLREYDLELWKLVREVMAYTGHVDWHLRP